MKRFNNWIESRERGGKRKDMETSERREREASGCSTRPATVLLLRCFWFLSGALLLVGVLVGVRFANILICP